jgi:hypothetical protein
MCVVEIVKFSDQIGTAYFPSSLKTMLAFPILVIKYGLFDFIDSGS